MELEETQADEPKKKNSDDSDDSDDDDDDKDKEKGLSNKKKKLQRRMKIAELKQQCMTPNVVEVWIATAADPRLLVFLKGYRNTVPVPRHWCQKRKFLQVNLIYMLGGTDVPCGLELIGDVQKALVWVVVRKEVYRQRATHNSSMRFKFKSILWEINETLSQPMFVQQGMPWFSSTFILS